MQSVRGHLREYRHKEIHSKIKTHLLHYNPDFDQTIGIYPVDIVLEGIAKVIGLSNSATQKHLQELEIDGSVGSRKGYVNGIREKRKVYRWNRSKFNIDK